MRLSALRHPLAAVFAVGGVALGSVAAMGGPASAAGDDLVGTTVFDCVVSTAVKDFPTYQYDGKITLSAVRPADSTTVTVSATMSKMSGEVPVTVSNVDFENTLELTADGTAVTLTGSGQVNIVANKPFTMPDLQGTFSSSAESVAIVTKAFSFKLPKFQMSGACVPTSGTELGTLTVVEGTTPTPTPTATTTTSATATPTTSSSASATATSTSGSEGTPAQGKATYACTLNIGSKFSWTPTISVAGYREDASDPVSLVASMTNLPGMAPVPIDGSMDYTLDLVVGGKSVTLKSTGTVSADPNAQVPVADLKGTVDVDGDELEVATTGFTFNFPSGGVGAECTAKKTSLGTLTVGTEAVDSGGSDSGSDSGSSTGSLPKTGGGDATPVIVLWAGAFLLLGAAVLLVVPGRAHRTREH